MIKTATPAVATLTFFLSVAIAGIILLGLPVNYYAGLFVVFFLLVLFLSKPLYFVLLLFFIRALLDNYLVAIRFTIAGIDIGLGGLFSLFLISGAVLYILIHAQNWARLKQGVAVMYFLYLLMSVGSALMTQDTTAAIRELIPRLSIFAVFIVVLLAVEDENQARLVLKTIVISAFFPVIYGFIQYAGTLDRLQGTFAHPNIMAFYLLIVLGCVVTQVHARESERGSFLSVFYFLLLLTALLLTLTRSSWIAFSLMGGVYVLFFKRKWFFPALILLILIVSVPIVKERLSDLFLAREGAYIVNKKSSLGWRLNVWNELWTIAVKKPFFGHGINASKMTTSYPTEAHNDFLRFFLESGVLGVVLYFGAYIYPLFHAVKRYASFESDSRLKRLAIFLICFVPAFFLMSISENLARYTTVHWYIMGILAVYFALNRVEFEKSSSAA
jgi:O-antigen ligase